jgi:hypothetical protein
MAGNSVWIRNSGNASARVRIRGAAEQGDDAGSPEKTFEFSRAKTDHQTGALEHNGYTRILQSDYDALYAGSNIFRSYVESGTFVLFETPPEEAFTAEQRVTMLEADKLALQGEVADLGAKLTAAQAGTVDTTALNDLQAAFDAYKTAHPESENIDDTSAEGAVEAVAGAVKTVVKAAKKARN